MPETEKPKSLNVENSVTEDLRTPDFAELQKQKESLFKEIEEESFQLSQKQKQGLVSLVAGHSVKDGLEMAKRLGLDGPTAKDFMTKLDVVAKNKSFFKKFDEFLNVNRQYIREETDLFKIDDSIQYGLTKEDWSINDVAEFEGRSSAIWAEPYTKNIDDYYLNFIKNRRVAPQEMPKDDRTQVEKTAEEHLVSAEAILKESYYTGPIRKFLGIDSEEELEAEIKELARGGHLSEWQSLSGNWRNDFITKETLDFFARHMAVNLETPEAKKVLREARYAPLKMVFEERKRAAEKGLVDQIKQSLIQRGFKEDEFEIKLNGESGQYEVVEKREEIIAETGKENLREVKDPPQNVIVDKEKLECGEYKSLNYRVSNFYKRINGRFYWLGFDKSKKWDEAGSMALIEDDHVYSDINCENLSVTDFVLVGGEVAVAGHPIVGNSIHPYEHAVRLGNKEFGPYDEIELCENSKDKLIFYAKKANEHFVYVDGEEHEVNLGVYAGENVRQISLVNNEIFLLNDTQSLIVRPKIEGVQERGAKSGTEITNLSEIDNELFCIWKSRSEDKFFASWNYHDIDLEITKTDVKVVVFKDSVFIADGKKLLTLKYNGGVVDLNEMEFDGEVEVVNSGGKLFIIETLADKKRVWEWSEKLELTEREQKDLDLANAVANEDLDLINQYFLQYYPEEGSDNKSRLQKAVERSKGFAKVVNQTIKEAPQLFLDTLRAKNDKPTEALMSEMFYYMFPEAKEKRERALKEARENKGNPWSVFGGMDRSTGGGRGGRGEQYDYDPGSDRLASMSEADYYETQRNPREVLRAREPFRAGDFIIHGTFAKWTGSGWNKVNVPISKDIADPARETTFEFVDAKTKGNINLPRIVNSSIIGDRIKGIKENNEEASVQILEENNLGEVRIHKDPDMEKVAYSQNVSEVPKTMAEITAEDYEKFRREFEKSFGDIMTAEIGDLGDEMDIFIRGIQDKTPREQVIAIQEFCYEYGYYNLDNEVRDTDNFEERLSIMEFRMNDLKKEKPELAGKKYAGICTDFASLTAAMLRRAGFVSGIASGFVPEAGSTSVKTDRAHAVAYVLWPNATKDKKPDLIVVDGTPASITPKIVELEARAAEAHKETEAEAEKKLAELERVLQTMDVEQIKNLSNGVLENTLNTILYGVKQSHVDVLERVLNASRYGGFDVQKLLDSGDMENELALRKFLESEVTKEKDMPHANRERRGEELFNLISEFSKRYRKDAGSPEVFNVLDKIFEISGEKLDPIEKRSAAAIITYLRARKMA